MFPRSKATFVAGPAAVLAALICGAPGSFAAGPAPTPGRLQTIVVGDKSYVQGGAAALRVIVRDHNTGEPVGGAAVRIYMEGKSFGTKDLWSGHTDTTGSIPGSFRIPAEIRGACTLVVRTAVRDDMDSVATAVRVEGSGGVITIDTDQERYRPGDQVRVTTGLGGISTGTRDSLILQLRDSAGRLRFARRLDTDGTGTYRCSIPLSPRLLVGDYRLTAQCGDSNAEHPIIVQQEAPPTARVRIDLDAPFHPLGARLSGHVWVKAADGATVAGAEVHVTLTEVRSSQIVYETSGHTKSAGEFPFTVQLPSQFPSAGPDGSSAIEIAATVRVPGGEPLRTVRNIPVGRSILRLNVVRAESVDATSGVPLTIGVYYPDGTPAECRITIVAGEHPLQTETTQFGVAACSVPAPLPQRLVVSARDAFGNSGTADLDLTSAAGDAAIQIHTVGSPLMIGAVQLDFDGGTDGPVYVDVHKSKHLVACYTAIMQNGHARLRFPAQPFWVGLICVTAYQKVIASDSWHPAIRWLWVEPDVGLTVQATKDRDNLILQVVDAQQQPVPATIYAGAAPVLSLNDVQDGTSSPSLDARARFVGELERLWGAGNNWQTLPKQVRLAAAARLAMLPQPHLYDYVLDSARPRAVAALRDWLAELNHRVETVQLAIEEFYRRHGRFVSGDEGVQMLVKTKVLKPDALFDPSGNPLVFSADPERHDFQTFAVTSAGPDQIKGTADDVVLHRVAAEIDSPPPSVPDAPAEVDMPDTNLADDAALTAADLRLLRERGQSVWPSAARTIGTTDGVKPLQVRADSFPAATTLLARDAAGRQGIATINPTAGYSWSPRLTVDVPAAAQSGDVLPVGLAVNGIPRDAKQVNWQVKVGDRTLFDGEDEVRFETAKRWLSIPVASLPMTIHVAAEVAAAHLEQDVEVRAPIAAAPEHYVTGFTVGTVKESLPAKVGDVSLDIDLRGTSWTTAARAALRDRADFRLYELLGRIVGAYGLYERGRDPKDLAVVEKAVELLADYGAAGFSLLPGGEARVAPTAAALLMLRDVANSRPAVQERLDAAVGWLKSQQSSQGYWTPDADLLDRGWGQAANVNVLPTALCVWALSRYDSATAARDRGVAYLKAHIDDVRDSYAIAVLANALSASGAADTRQVIEKLFAVRTTGPDSCWWETDTTTVSGERGSDAGIETTALALNALCNAGRTQDVLAPGLTWVARRVRDDQSWGSALGTWLLVNIVESWHRRDNEIRPAPVVKLGDEIIVPRISEASEAAGVLSYPLPAADAARLLEIATNPDAPLFYKVIWHQEQPDTAAAQLTISMAATPDRGVNTSEIRAVIANRGDSALDGAVLTFRELPGWELFSTPSLPKASWEANGTWHIPVPRVPSQGSTEIQLPLRAFTGCDFHAAPMTLFLPARGAIRGLEIRFSAAN